MSRALATTLKSSRLGCRCPGRQFASTVPPLPGKTSRTTRGLQVGTAIASLTALYYIYTPSIQLDSNPETGGFSPPKIQAESHGLIPYAEVQKHNSEDDCWVVIEGKVYDLTQFAQEAHPGGPGPIHKAAGRDATQIFMPIHPPGTIETHLDPSAYVGNVDPTTLPEMVVKGPEEKTEREITLGEIIGLPDFEEAARRKLTSKAWAYMSAGATDMHTLGLNRSSFNQILFRPRVLVDVDEVDTSTKMLGQDVSMPIFLCPTGLAALAHPLGERLLSQAAGECDAMYMVSTNASVPLPEIIGSKYRPDQPFFMQLYVDKNRTKAEALIKKINDQGVKGIFVTVDTAAPGKREADERSLAEIQVASGDGPPGLSSGKISPDKKGGGVGRTAGNFIDRKLNWSDIAWLRRHTKVPIGLKGVQTVEDCMKAADLGVDAIYLSNHGGRALDGSPPALYTLLEINKFCPEILDKCEIYLDGGVRRGTDVIKALCLGAKGVGLGRPFLYSLTYGKEGVVHGLEIMRDELETTLRLLGVTSLDQLGPHMINTKALDNLIADAPSWGPKEKRSRTYLRTPFRDAADAAANQE